MPEPAARIESPCVRQCCLDEQDVCLGCGRHLDEILAWHAAGDAVRQQILALAAERRRQRILRHLAPPAGSP